MDGVEEVQCIYDNEHYHVLVEERNGSFAWDDHMMANAQYAIVNSDTGVVEGRLCSLPSAIVTADKFSEFLENRELSDKFKDVIGPLQ